METKQMMETGRKITWSTTSNMIKSMRVETEEEAELWTESVIQLEAAEAALWDGIKTVGLTVAGIASIWFILRQENPQMKKLVGSRPKRRQSLRCVWQAEDDKSPHVMSMLP